MPLQEEVKVTFIQKSLLLLVGALISIFRIQGQKPQDQHPKWFLSASLCSPHGSSPRP